MEYQITLMNASPELEVGRASATVYRPTNEDFQVAIFPTGSRCRLGSLVCIANGGSDAIWVRFDNF